MRSLMTEVVLLMAPTVRPSRCACVCHFGAHTWDRADEERLKRSHSTMPKILYHASHEQFAPSRLLQWTKRAEKAGFDGFFSSDHFHPWSEAQGQSGFSWSWV